MAENKGVLVPKSDNKGVLVQKSNVVVQAGQTTSHLPNQIGNPEARFRLPVPFTGSIRSVLYFLGLTIARLIRPSAGRSCGRMLERRGNGRGRGQGRGRCSRN